MNLALNEIAVRPDDYQRRKAPYAEQTVEAILAEGYDGAKFDPIPVARIDGRWVVAGDGHSRLEALKRLRAAGREAPNEVPVRVVSTEQAEKLADTANVSRTPFSPVEEARIIKRRLDDGDSLDRIAIEMHRSPCHARQLAHLTSLSKRLQDLVDRPYGLSLTQAIRFARMAEKFGWTPEIQDAVFDEIKECDLTDRVLSIALEAIGKRLAMVPAREEGSLFQLPPNVKSAVSELDRMYRRLNRARGLLRSLAQYADLFRQPEILKALGEPLRLELEGLEAIMKTEALSLGDERPNASRFVMAKKYGNIADELAIVGRERMCEYA